jgi:hypothetical protein
VDAGVGLDPAEDQVADVEIAIMHVAVVVAPELLLVPSVLQGCGDAVLLD